MAKRRRKSEDEARIERVTWFLMVLVFAVLYVLPDASVAPWTVPAAGAVILLGSGLLQYLRRWRVSPVTWIGGTVMLLLALINVYVEPDQNFFGIVLLTFAAVIGFGVLTGET
jgi:Na+/melibiose symporter-like transporter